VKVEKQTVYSNCLIEAIKAKLLNFRKIKIYKRGSWLEIFQRKWPHFYWYHKPSNKYYHYSQEDTLSWLQQLWYKGSVMEFKYHN